MSQANGREPVLILAGVSTSEADRFYAAILRLHVPVRLLSVQKESVKSQIQELPPGSVKLVVAQCDRFDDECASFVSELRASSTFPRAPVIILGPSLSSDEIASAERSGVNSCLATPTDEELERLIRYWVDLNLTPRKAR
jgi:hypothetical protein